MIYNLSTKTTARVDNYLSKNAQSTDAIKNDLQVLKGNITSHDFSSHLDDFIKKHSLSTVFAYQNKLTGFFLKMDQGYDKQRKIEILGHLSSMIDNRKGSLTNKLALLQKDIDEKCTGIITKFSKIIPIVNNLKLDNSYKHLNRLNLCNDWVKSYDASLNRIKNKSYDHHNREEAVKSDVDVWKKAIPEINRLIPLLNAREAIRFELNDLNNIKDEVNNKKGEENEFGFTELP